MATEIIECVAIDWYFLDIDAKIFPELVVLGAKGAELKFDIVVMCMCVIIGM